MNSLSKKRPNPSAPNPAIASWLDSGHHRRGVGEPDRSARLHEGCGSGAAPVRAEKLEQKDRDFSALHFSA